MQLRSFTLCMGLSISLATHLPALAGSDFTRGDVNCDHVIDHADVALIQQHVFGGFPLTCMDAADANDNGTVDINDINYLLAYLGSGGPPPPQPFPNCGPDPTADAISCTGCCGVVGGCDAICLTAPDFSPTGDTSIAGGNYNFCDFVVANGVDVSVTGPCTLNVAGTFMIDSAASLSSMCNPLVINHLQDSGSLKIYGVVSDTCPSPNDSGGTFVLRSPGSMILGRSGGGQPAMIRAADIFIGDPDYAPRPQPDSVIYSLTGESTMTNLSPVANIRGTSIAPATIEIEIIELSLTGLPMQGTLHYGDGDSTVNPPLTVQHVYQNAGTYRVVYSLADNQGNIVRPSLVVEIPSGRILQGCVSPFVPSSLRAMVDQSVSFVGQAPPGCASAEWDFDGNPAGGPNASHAYPDPGMHIAYFTYSTEDGKEYEAQAPVYCQLAGAKKGISDPPAPNLPFPGCYVPPPFRTDAVPDTHSTACAPCSLCYVAAEALGYPTGSTVLLLGDLTITSTRIGGWVVTGYKDATIIIRPGFSMSGADGKDGGVGGSGRGGGGYAQITLTGQIVECGGSYAVGSGGDGGAEGLAGCPAISKGGRGGDAGGVAYLAPMGSVTWCGDIEIFGGNGGDGGASASLGNPVGACTNGCSAYSTGGRGGLGGGGFVALAASMCFDSAYSVTFWGANVGGNGGKANSTASDGGNCGICSFKAGNGGHAGAKGGHGGGSFFYFGMSPMPPPGALVGHLFPLGSWTGGDGGDADADAGNGGNALVDCCQPPMPGIDGGNGGFGDAHGGRKGLGATTSGAPGNGNATCGNGGNGKDGSPPGAGGGGSIAHDDILPAVPCNIVACPPGIPGLWCPQPNIPWNFRWDLPSGYKFPGNDTTLSGSLYHGTILSGPVGVKLLGQPHYGQLSGDNAAQPVYSDEDGFKRCTPGGVAINLSTVPQGARGFYAVLNNYSTQSNSLHLMAYSGGVLVSHQIGNGLCAETTLEVPVTLAKSADGASQVLDSVILWGLDYSFEGDVGIGAEVPSACPIVLTGDVNVNGTITSADIIYLVNYVFKGGANPQPCAAAGDVNCNGAVTSADIIHLVNYVFKGGIPPCDGCTSSLAGGC